MGHAHGKRQNKEVGRVATGRVEEEPGGCVELELLCEEDKVFSHKFFKFCQ